ncbi:MAG: DNA mismatch repair endonuclease MutL [Bacteroidetes bacterium]|nr:DNA mismatch repair endonuclease MutL [Bacteroidota bacterium]
MPNIIRILTDQIANQIAAGEVVQRPESVVKELIENCVDAGATHITVVLKDSGKTLIQILDNGCGMSPDDARLAFERHATSKIEKAEDLQDIRTLGFRGEALASIASVSQSELKTREHDAKTGTLVRVEGGIFKAMEPVSCAAGTNITIKNLFFNTPGRRNFLKSEQVEFRHILDTVQKYALFYSDLRWTLISDDSQVFDVLPATPLERVGQLFGEKVKSHVIEIKEDTDLVSISGFVAHPTIARKSRGDQYLFINGRAIIHKSIQHAVFNAYGASLAAGTYPFYVIFFSIDPKRVDINVHPTKQEVKFDDERSVYAITMAVIRKFLSKHDLTPQVSGGMTHVIKEDVVFDPNRGFVDQTRFVERPSSPISNFPYIDPAQRIVSLPFGSGTIPSGGTHQRTEFQDSRLADIPRSVGSPLEVLRSFASEVDNSAIGERRIWQVHNKYVFSQIVTGLMIIDQHVAHERILYEKAMKVMQSSSAFTQQLLFPYTMDLTPLDFELIKSLKDDLQRLGFDFKFYSGKTVVVEGVPADVKPGAEQRILQDILTQYRDYESEFQWKGRQNLAASYACRSSIKAGDPLSLAEMNELIDSLFACENPYTCPHGRPVVVKMTVDDLDSRFGRKHPW